MRLDFESFLFFFFRSWDGGVWGIWREDIMEMLGGGGFFWEGGVGIGDMTKLDKRIKTPTYLVSK